MAWIESHQELARHPKTKKLARLLGVTLPTAIGHLHLLWWWAMDYAQDGDLSKYDEYDIADACSWEGEARRLLNSLIESEFIDETDGGLVIHDWHEYAGRLIEKREQNKERKKKSRARHAPVTRPSQENSSDANDGHAPVTGLPNLTIPNQTINNNSSSGSNSAENPFRLFESEGFGTISSVIADRINMMIDDYGERWVCEAMKVAVYYGKRNLSYVDSILKRWKAEGIDSPWEKDRQKGGEAGAKHQGRNQEIRSGKDSPTNPEESITGGRVGWLAKDRVQKRKMQEV